MTMWNDNSLRRAIPRTATIVVAASNSSAAGKAQADYACAGTSDDVVIQEALNALPASGGKVLLLEGTYNISSSITLKSNQTLSGVSPEVVLNCPTTIDIIQGLGTAASHLSNIIVSDFKTIGSCAVHLDYVDYSKILNLIVQSVATRDGIWVEDSNYNEIRGCIVSGGYYGIESYYTLWSVIENNIVMNNSQSGILVNGVGNEAADRPYVIAGNLCISNGGYAGIENYCAHAVISGNGCYGNTDDGIFSATIDCTITGNVCQSNGFCGIEIDYGAQDAISGNTCIGNTYHGIDLWDCNYETVSGNNCQNNGQAGIEIGGNGGTVNHCTVVGNICVGNSQTTNNTYDDIEISYGSYNNIQGNTCRAGTNTNKPRYGINISTAWGACTGNSIVNNDLYNDGFGTGVLHDAGTSAVKSGNRGYNPLGYAMPQPAVPASGSYAQNTYGYPVRVTITGTGSGITAYSIKDASATVNTFTTTVAVGWSFMLAPGESMALTYTGTPTWVWDGQ
jgi:parallel beta-helix repeat protein